ncbi:hypothetical protein FJQ98_16085 [Lysinibacillus agricola]|uniref:Uncharacterized protein n=1 Tax=Lysinibacillus agricola TaxID=2590012 RepID=A0ABX7ALV4_9BACI|nr:MULTISPECIES: hypothetical protein [Lysinibacillus]KOS61538.1 hypothetical protein AN161_18285 [Lysinibacillus sp. FJAT-14222]QQP10765.1 hypothetical protein FJQ98_16085 [Lysinibacillus agricola]
MKKFKKHKFISMEKLCRIFDKKELNIHLYRDELSYWDYVIWKKDIVKVGYGQYTFLNVDQTYFDIKFKNNDCEKVEFMNIRRKLKEIITLEELKEFSQYSKIKPIYKFTDFDDIPLNCESGELGGKYSVTLVGLLMK